MYRQKIQDEYSSLSPSYRRVGDFVVSRYYDVAFMTAAQLAAAVDVDTTTVVRFSQRLGYPGYPELLQDVRAQVKEELYAVYEPVALGSHDPAAIFKARIDQESANLRQILIHNPPNRLQSIVQGIRSAARIVLVAEGELGVIVGIAADQLRGQGLLAEAVTGDPARLATILSTLTPGDALMGLSPTDEESAVGRALSFAQAQGCPTYALVGRLDGPLHRAADEILYAPSEVAGFRPDILALTGALLALVSAVEISAAGNGGKGDAEAVRSVYRFVTEPQDSAG
ncbi:MAG: MurR/RpiR family transcriptional regulator [Caldilineaceae bacterium]|nr:MurR/RpiR family transcriptional regulator [Caldilineaceae bacterium]